MTVLSKSVSLLNVSEEELPVFILMEGKRGDLENACISLETDTFKGFYTI
jgi:hypothetical protein